LSAGRNIGISNSGCELIALTDDDCEVQSDWPEELVSAFAPDQRIGVVLGNVLPGPHDRLRGFIPSYIRSEPFMARSIREKPEVEGIGACMGLRRSCWHDLGGFDPLLGAGARFRAGEEVDLIIRALTAGYFVYETPRLAVTHLGFRSWRESRELIGGHLYGLGAAFAKQVRCRHRGVIPILAKLAERWAFKQPAVYYGLRRQRRLRLVSFLRGFWAGLLTPVDRTRGHFGCGN